MALTCRDARILVGGVDSTYQTCRQRNFVYIKSNTLVNEDVDEVCWTRLSDAGDSTNRIDMIYFDRLDAFFMQEGYEVTSLEQAARCCLIRAQEAKTIAGAMMAQGCAIDIRNLPGWTVYQKRKL